MIAPRPLPRPKPKRPLKVETMTVCIAAACEQGTKVVVATDRLISYAGIAANNIPAKMYWLDDWLVMYAGQPANTSLIIDGVGQVLKPKLARENIQQSFKVAYQNRKAFMSSFQTLSAYNMSIEEFQRNGYSRFGADEFKRISQEISQASSYFNEQLLVIGWGKTEKAVMLYEISPDGDRDHRISGVAAIGSGSEVALSTMMLLGQNRDSSLADTMYTIAAAKFASEKTSERDVGDQTAMYITWKRTAKDAEDRPTGKDIQHWQIARLHKIWNRYGKPSIPRQAYPEIVANLRELQIKSSSSTAMLNALMRSASRKSKRAQ
jgi:20S proteasome alpha/beta subunit